MAKIWPVYDGREPTTGGPWARLPLREAIEWLDLTPERFLRNLDVRPGPKFGDTSQDLSWKGYQHVVVEIGRDETGESNWQPGFYESPLTPREAFRRIVENVVAPAFGTESVVRVDADYKSAIDSHGEDALRITVVLTPDAVDRYAQQGALGALFELRGRLREIGEFRTPIVDYATEAELAQDAGA